MSDHYPGRWTVRDEGAFADPHVTFLNEEKATWVLPWVKAPRTLSLFFYPEKSSDISYTKEIEHNGHAFSQVGLLSDILKAWFLWDWLQGGNEISMGLASKKRGK